MTKRMVSLCQWVEAIGVKDVAANLKLERSAVRHWLTGYAFPSQPVMAKIRILSKGRVDLNRSIDQHFSSSNKFQKDFNPK